jgi:ABC-2 type transport system ATP-binding protein
LSEEPDGAVVLRDLCVTFGSREVLTDMSYIFPTSTVTAILGPNGAGKTTLLRTIIGVVQPRKGEVLVMSRPAGSLEAKAKIGYLAEQPGLYERLTALDNLLFHAKLRGFQGDGFREEASSLLRKYGLEGYEKVGVSKFSKGMKQRLALARTAMGNPPVLLLDEPTSGLDPDGSELAMRSIREAARGGASVLMTTHNAYLARRVADSVLLIKEGEVSSSGTFDEVLRPYGRVRVKLLAPVDPSEVQSALARYAVEVLGPGPVVEFLVRVEGKAEVPILIKAMLDGGLRPVSVEPGEITYERGGR